MKHLLYLLVPLAALLPSCISTPDTRIQRNPELFSALSSEHKQLVRHGKIAQGMSKPAVFLAMGHPDNKTSGVQHGKSFERWNYNTLVPVYTYEYTPYYGYGRYGCRGGYYGHGYQPSVHYVPRHGSTVEFQKGKASSWSIVNRRFQ